MRTPLLLVCACLMASFSETRASAMDHVTLKRMDDRVRVEIGGHFFTEYIFKGAHRPYLYPVLMRDGTSLTRHFPMKKQAGEDEDHPHHRSLWFAHSNINGVDFWNEDMGGSPRPKGKIIHDSLVEVAPGSEGVIRARN